MTRKLKASWYDAIVKRANEIGGVQYGKLCGFPGPVGACLYGIAIDAGLYGEEARQVLQSEGATNELYQAVDKNKIDDLSYNDIDLAMMDAGMVDRTPVLEVFALLGIEREREQCDHVSALGRCGKFAGHGGFHEVDARYDLP